MCCSMFLLFSITYKWTCSCAINRIHECSSHCAVNCKCIAVRCRALQWVSEGSSGVVNTVALQCVAVCVAVVCWYNVSCGTTSAAKG